jgi:hypothetical protein
MQEQLSRATHGAVAEEARTWLSRPRFIANEIISYLEMC